ncbi:MAG TPA: DMT family transporter [Clostridia bacterium]|nr:DMT family transporter [Clostridia bacterium]
MSNKTKAIVYMLLSTFSFSAMQIVVKASGSMPVMQQVFARNLVTAVFSFGFLLYRREKLFGSRENQPILLVRSIFGYIGVVFYFYATQHMISADAAILHRSSPFFVTLFAALFLKERLSLAQIIALFTAAFGAILVVQPQMSSSTFPAVVALLSAVAAGAAYTAISCLKGKESSACIILYFSAFSCLASLLIGGKYFVRPDISGYAALLAIGCFAAIGQLFLTISYKMAKASEVSIFNYSGVVFAGVLGAIFFDETLGLISLLGMTLIIAAALLIYFNRETV